MDDTPPPHRDHVRTRALPSLFRVVFTLLCALGVWAVFCPAAVLAQTLELTEPALRLPDPAYQARLSERQAELRAYERELALTERELKQDPAYRAFRRRRAGAIAVGATGGALLAGASFIVALHGLPHSSPMGRELATYVIATGGAGIVLGSIGLAMSAFSGRNDEMVRRVKAIHEERGQLKRQIRLLHRAQRDVVLTPSFLPTEDLRVGLTLTIRS